MTRVYFSCGTCRTGEYTGDARLGVSGRYTRQARRLICLAGASWSFAAAEQHLHEFCGLRVSAGTVRKVCDCEATDAQTWDQRDEAATQNYRESSGEVEFLTDGTCVNTTEGWKEMRLGIFAKRPRGAAAEPEDWDTRRLPATTARYAFAAIESCDTFAARWPQVASRLGIRCADRIDVLADGARWIWDRVQTYWPQADGALDVYHALEHVAETAKTMYGEAAPQCERWLDEARDALLADGYPGIERVITQARADAVRGPQRDALTRLENYLRPHQRHLDYAGRLAEGRSIGSGLVEGACKNWIGRRMKQTGARWRVERAGRMATLTSLLYSDNWQTYWENAA